MDESTEVVAPQRSLGGDESPTVTNAVSDAGFLPSSRLADEDTVRTFVREQAMREVPKLYSLILEHLDLTSGERDALLSFLIENRIAGTSTSYTRGKTMDELERSRRIAAIIGDAKRQQFLALERNIGSYAEVQYVASILEQHAVPMTETQRDRILEIMIEVQNQELTLPGSDSDRGSNEYLEYLLAETDERERLVFEQAASVLSAEQVGYWFERYQRDSYRRAAALERQKEARADDNVQDLPLHYPGRSTSQ